MNSRGVLTVLRHWDDTHGVGVSRAGTPASQNDHHITSLEESTSFTDIHGEVDPQVHVLGPHIIRWAVVVYGENTTVKMSLSSCLFITSHR